MANIDYLLYGQATLYGDALGYIIDSRKEKRINQYMAEEETIFSFAQETSFWSNPYPRSFLYID